MSWRSSRGSHTRQTQVSEALACLLVLASSALRVAGQIRVMSPNALINDLGDGGRVPGSTATFGAPFYGDRVQGLLVYGETKGQNHCTYEDYSLPDDGTGAPKQEREGTLIRIVVVKRGKCSFTRKVHVAYAKGAHAVLIVDKENTGIDRDGLQNIIVADDGYGDNITIPSVLITNTDGNKMLKYLQDVKGAVNEGVLVELVWDIPANHVVTVDKWMSTGSTESMKFMKEFAPKRRILNELLAFQPRFNVFSLNGNQPLIFNDLCWSKDNGTFCTEDPDGPGEITGKMVLEEDVRMLCIHDNYKITKAHKTTGQPVVYAKEFWDYIEKFGETCPILNPGDKVAPKNKFHHECSTNLMGRVGIDVKVIEDCVTKSAKAKLTEQLYNRAWSPRAMRINGWRYKGMLAADLVIRAICDGFVEKPPECAKLVTKRDPKQLYTGKPSSGFSTGGALMWLFFTALLCFGALLLYKRYLKKEMRSTLREEVMLEVQAQMGEYSKMTG